MSNIVAVTQVMNGAISHLVQNKIPVTLENHYQIIHDWYMAWKSVASDTKSEQELLEALEVAHDRLYCKMMNIQF